MRHEEIYNMVRTICGSLLMVALFMMPSCDDERVGEEPQELIQMWLDGNEIPVYDYYESVTTYGVKSLTDSGDVKKVFVIHFQKDAGRISPEKEHYALIMYDNDGADNGQPIDEKLYVGGTAVDSLRPDLLEATSGRITLEIVGLSDFTEFAQATISKYEDGLISGIADGYFFNPYRNEMQHGVIIFDNLEVGSDPEATFYQGVY